MKFKLIVALVVLSQTAFGGGWTSTAAVDQVEIIRGQGFEIIGAFGNPSECINGNRIFVAVSHPQYDQLLSVALAAFMGDKQLRMYSHSCINYGWHGGTSSELGAAGSMYLVK